ncbi:MOSC domain-containing protein [Seleniivibrio woodruffii]|uniref:Molybdenum cofactor synthesis domain-containing protein n=1 Tax=Seleniivibrio woodruffii TaxID=1078050 RepID=A0A4R1KEG3_9BACT|nr:MOSC domain-containing protein [Seleniivibrio woodruffii]TCK62470.1 molybdenum cofactor synthesis domain-containing protein [Seleniivibrio woodruffii]TVZ37103.1 molybdenum cofactor synthesis domain-containing protein [Seleniivibrio woodruffii]
MAKVQSLNISETKGVRKTPVDSVKLVTDFGIANDAHAGKWHRQVSLLATESIKKMKDMGLDVTSGDFAENITTEGIDLMSLIVGDTVNIGGVDITISQLGKICHHRCAIFYQAGDCVMPREGIFGVVRNDGDIKVGDEVTFKPKEGLSVCVITLSDKGSKGEREDETGPAVLKLLKEKLNVCFSRIEMQADDQEPLENTLKYMCDLQKFDLVVTNGSTGVSPRDIAPDATLNVITKRMPGFEEAMRMESFKKTNRALISRAVVGARGNTLIVNVPGSPKGAVENLEVIIDAIPHCIEKLQGSKADCAQ